MFTVLFILATAQITAQQQAALTSQLQHSITPFLMCVRENSRAWAISTNEPVGDVVDGAIASCGRQEKAARDAFIDMGIEHLGMARNGAAEVWDDFAPEMHKTARGVGLTAALNARSKP